MGKRLVLVFISVCLGLTVLFAQVNTQSFWMASFNTFSLSSKWSVHLDVQARSTDNLNQVQTLIFRPGINFNLPKNQMVTLGYAYIPNRVFVSEDNKLLSEHRIWQQYLIVQKIAGIPVQHRLRLEQRFIPVPALGDEGLYTSKTNFATRLRYFTRGIIPMVKNKQGFTKGSFAAIQNEVFLNTTHTNAVNGDTFDQNRLYVAFGYRIAKGFDIEGGYMWQYVNTRGNNANINNHIGQIAIYWRK